MYAEARGQLQGFLFVWLVGFILFLRQGVSLAWKPIRGRLGWLASELQRLACLCF